jgi:nicotinamidase-related amidase
MKRALLVIDVQNEYFTGVLPISYPSGSLERVLDVMDVAAQQSIPVIVVRHTETPEDTPFFKKGSPEWELHPKIAERSYDLLVDKTVPGSFTNTNLEEWLRSHEIDTLVISGYMTHMCCDTTARQAFHAGFDVEFLSDATGTLDFESAVGAATGEELHRAVLVTHHDMFSQVMTTDEWKQRVEVG